MFFRKKNKYPKRKYVSEERDKRKDRISIIIIGVIIIIAFVTSNEILEVVSILIPIGLVVLFGFFRLMSNIFERLQIFNQDVSLSSKRFIVISISLMLLAIIGFFIWLALLNI